MLLLEHKGKELLRQAGIKIPPAILVNNKSYINLSYHKEQYREFFMENQAVVIKAQIASGKRKKNGLIVMADDYADSLQKIDELYKRDFNGLRIDTLLIEKKLDVQEEYFLAIMYDTKERMPMIVLSKQGGIDVEEFSKENEATIMHISTMYGLRDFEARTLAKAAGFEGKEMLRVVPVLKHAWKAFVTYDCRILEINPLIRTKEGLLVAGDAKITIDDSGIARQEIFADVTEIEDRSRLSARALEARKIDYHDYRGVAGKTFIELDGDIAVLASGGGASLAVMDALLEAGGKPANYTEYSGNPPKEKVKKLTEITLSKPGLKGCLVVGGTANFTDIYETLSGVKEALEKINPEYPVVIRRAGPRDKEAFDMLAEFEKKSKIKLTLMGEETPMTKAARTMVEQAYGS